VRACARVCVGTLSQPIMYHTSPSNQI